MKKLFFLLAMLAGIAASATVTVTPIGTDFTTQKVTFKVEYSAAANNRAWVWIDLCPVSGVTPATFQTAVISAVSTTGGSVDAASLNGRGFYVTISPSTVTATLSNATGKFNWCAHGSDYPPNVTASNGTYTLRGTPPFTLKDAGGATQIVQGKTIPASSLTIVPITMTDATGCPSYFCNYVGADLYFNTTYKCRQRTSGAGNWEAYIRDVRDNQIYRIVKMPTGTWWMADDLLWDGKPNPAATNYTVRGTPRSCGVHYGCGRFYQADANGAGAYSGTANDRRTSDVCLNGWLIPSANEFQQYNTLSTDPDIYLSEREFGGLNTYGLSLYTCGTNGWECGTDHTAYNTGYGGCYSWWRGIYSSGAGCEPPLYGVGRNVRCVRDL
jgi:hypothetical protein